MIRRTHLDTVFGAKLLDLPKPSEKTHWVSFNEIERKIYRIVETRFIQRVNSISRTGQAKEKYTHIFAMLIRLRQLCCHTILIADTILDLLEREDFEELNRLVEDNDEDNIDPQGASILVALRSMLSAHAEATEDSQLGRNVTETETRPIDVIDFAELHKSGDDNGGPIYGGMHGLNFRVGKYLDSVRKPKHLQGMMERSVCSACRQSPRDPYITSCMHIYCHACLKHLQHFAAKRGKDCASCAICKADFHSSQPCIELRPSIPRESPVSTIESERGFAGRRRKRKVTEVDAWINMSGEVLPSAKTMAVKAQILEWLQSDRKVKIIVYTQFLPMVKILAKVCDTEDWGYCTYTGIMSHDARDQAIEDFKKKDGNNILLASLRSGGLGLNLTMASRVILIDPSVPPTPKHFVRCPLTNV